MSRDDMSLKDNLPITLAILASTGAVFGLLFVTFVCTWCFPKKRNDEEQMLKGAVVQSSDGPTPNQSITSGLVNLGLMKSKKSTLKEGEVEVTGIDYQLGKIQFGVSYNDKNQELTLKIFRAQDLPATDMSGFCDPYVRITILPNEKKEFRTQVRKNKLNPVWNESFLFQGWNKKKLQEKTLYLLVLDFDRLKKDDQVGELFIPLSAIDLNSNQSWWYYLQPCKDNKENRLGELYVTLCYDAADSKLTVGVIKAKDLLMLDVTGASDPFVKTCVIIHGSREERRKTPVKHNASNPAFNELYSFHVPSDKIQHTSVEFTVLDHDQFDNDDLIGKILLGAHSSPPEARHWNDMIFRPRETIERWHVLHEDTHAGDD